MEKLITLKKNKEFRRAYFKGTSLASPVLVTYVLKNRENTNRVGITASKKTGNAIKRNRARRIIKEAYRQLFDKLKTGIDIVFVARAQTPVVKTDRILKDMTYHLKKLGAWK